KVLNDQRRFDALRQLMEQQIRRLPDDPQKHNLMGLALLESDPGAAVEQFKTALRYNLHYGPAYLNLSQAYQKLLDTVSARLCLKRYLRLMPYGAAASDVRQRLAALSAVEN